jgi:hypothetical protein
MARQFVFAFGVGLLFLTATTYSSALDLMKMQADVSRQADAPYCKAGNHTDDLVQLVRHRRGHRGGGWELLNAQCEVELDFCVRNSDVSMWCWCQNAYCACCRRPGGRQCCQPEMCLFPW